MLPHCAGAFPIDCSNVRWIAGADMAPTGQMSVALQCAPAAGISAAGNWQDFGTSRWQLSKSAYTNFRDAGRRRDFRNRPDFGAPAAIHRVVILGESAVAVVYWRCSV
jgi:hypothetical protein